jgi:uncharacterized protein YdhG (YjbR/CyaY superfamily)
MATPESVEEYLAGIPEESRAALEELRATIGAAAPEATETISYQMPAFRDQGRILVWYAAFSRHCSLFPASEGVVEACGEEIAPYLHGKGTIRFTPEQPLSRALVRKIVEARLRENAALPRR